MESSIQSVTHEMGFARLASAKVGNNSAAVKTATGLTTAGAYSVTLSKSDYFPNQKIAVRVQDSALNVYENQSIKKQFD